MDIEEICKDIIESQLTAIVDGLKIGDESPEEVCESIMACTD